MSARQGTLLPGPYRAAAGAQERYLLPLGRYTNATRRTLAWSAN
jgi:hypothetical protein